MTNTEKNYILIEKLRYEARFFIFNSYYPTKTKKIRNLLAGFGTFIYCWSELLVMVPILYFQANNLSKLSETLLFFITQFAFLCKLTNFVLKNHRMTFIEKLLKEPVLNNLTEDYRKILKNYLDPFRRLTVIYRFLCFGCVLFYGSFPNFDKNPDNFLPHPAWFPFDIKKYKYEVLIAELMGLSISAFNNSNIDIITNFLITLGTAQFDILKIKMQNFTVRNGESFGKNKGVIKARLSDIVLHHNTLLRFVAEIENIFSSGIFVQFLASVAAICLTGFQMTVIDFNSVQFLLLITYFSTMMCQVIMYCWYGHQIMHSSTGILEACYLSEWHKCDKEICEMLKIIMEKGKQPVILTAGGVFSLSLGTLMKILRSSYSYFAVLQQIYKK